MRFARVIAAVVFGLTLLAIARGLWQPTVATSVTPASGGSATPPPVTKPNAAAVSASQSVTAANPKTSRKKAPETPKRAVLIPVPRPEMEDERAERSGQ